MSKILLAALLALSGLLSATPASAQTGTRDQIRMIEQEYARQANGQIISDAQLEYYLDRSNSGWSMAQIGADMRQYTSTPWRPQSGWMAREVVCTSINNQYRECAAPFRGTAVVTLQISSAPCIEGQSWGQRPGTIWVNRGCRARFGIIATTPNPQLVVCQSNRGRYRECPTNFRRQVRLVNTLPNSRPCVEGRSWGQRPGTVWVRGGCRAQFAQVRRVPRDNYGTFLTNFYVICASTGGTPNRCSWDQRYGQPRLSQQLSTVPCIEGRTWGYDERYDIWVSNGCRGRFVSSLTDWNRGDSTGRNDTPWVRDTNYSVTCISDNGRRSICTWDSRYGTPRLVEQMSSTACVEGRDWGYDSQGGLWVDAGCRARFGFR